MRQLVLFLCLTILIVACSEDFGAPDNEENRLALAQQALHSTMAHVAGGTVNYLDSRLYTISDVKEKHARYRICGQKILVEIPIIRYLNDSTSTMDSLTHEPVRTYMLSEVDKKGNLGNLWIVEETPLEKYYSTNRMTLWYDDLTGAAHYYSESGQSYRKVQKNDGTLLLPNGLSGADSGDIDGGDLDSVVIIGHKGNGGSGGSSPSLWEGFTGTGCGSEDLGDIGKDLSGGGSSNSGSQKDKKPKEATEDCSGVYMKASKDTVYSVYKDMNNSTETVIGAEKLYSFEAFKEAVKTNREVEWGATFREVDGYGKGFGDIRTDYSDRNVALNVIEGDHSLTATIHTHPNGSPLSAKDIISLVEGHQTHENYRTMMVWDDQTDTYYCATIMDSKKAQNFYVQLKDQINEETGWWEKPIRDIENSDLFRFWKKQLANLDCLGKVENSIFQMAAIFSKYDAGISLVKIQSYKDNQGQISYGYTAYDAVINKDSKYIKPIECE